MRLRTGDRRRCREHGQGTVEYVALILIVAAALVTSVASDGGLAPFVQQATGDGMAKAVCIVLDRGHCDEPGDDEGPNNVTANDYGGPAWDDPSKTPLERATWGDYAALGDSYSSGEGASSDYEEGTDDADFGCKVDWHGVHCDNGPDKNTCHRSANAYGPRIARRVDFKGKYTFAACSGAVAEDLDKARDAKTGRAHQDGERAQLDHVDENTSLITLSIGGNDADFAGIIQDCVKAGVDPTRHCSDKADEIRRKVDGIRNKVSGELTEARKRAPNARIIVVGYPRLFPVSPAGGNDDTVIDPEDQRFLNGEAGHINQVIQAAVDDAGGTDNGIEFVNPYDAFNGCEIGTDDPCMNDFKFGTWDGRPPASAGSYHPNGRGQQRLADLVERQIEQGSQ